MLLRTRIVLIFAIATVLLIAAVATPFVIMQQLAASDQQLARREAQEVTWDAAVADAVTPYEILAARLSTDPLILDSSQAANTTRLTQLLEDRRREAGVFRLDVIGGDGRLFASSAGMSADSPLLDTTNLRNRVQQTTWLRGLVVAPDGSLLLGLTTALPGGRFLSVAATAEPALQSMARRAKGSLFIVNRSGALQLSTAPDQWPEIDAARRRGGETASITRKDGNFVATSTALFDMAGSRVSTLIVVRDETAAAQRQSLVLLLTGSVAALVFAALVFALYGLAKDALDPLGEITAVIRAMAGGDTTVSIDVVDRKDEVGAIAEALEVFRHDIVTLARNKTRESLRQAQQLALIRREMTILAGMLEDDEREALLSDLRGTLASVEGGAVLAEAFKRMAARVVAQHTKLRALLAERSRDLAVVRDALAERAHLSRLRQELEVARHLQLSSLPRVFPPYPSRTDFDLFAAMEPAKEVGGDFYDFTLIGGERLAVMIGDASGKGVSAAMFIAMGRSILRSAIVRGASPAQALALANSTLAVENHTMMFATVFVGVLDLSTGWLTYGSAGHNPPYLMSPTEALRAVDGPSGIALGIIEDAEYEDGEVQMTLGSSLVMFTDGVTEAGAPDGSMFGEEGLEEALRRVAKDDPEQAVHAIQEAVRRFAREEEQADDITVLATRWLGPMLVDAQVLQDRLPAQPLI